MARRLRCDHHERGRVLRSARPGPRPDPESDAAARRSSRHRHGDLRRPLPRHPSGHGRLDPPGGRGQRAADLARLRVHTPARVLPPVHRGLRRPARPARRTPDRQVHRPRRTRHPPVQRRGALLGPAAGDPGTKPTPSSPTPAWAVAAKGSSPAFP
ncbi:hypothetical protein STAN_5741 [Streptomyces sp. CBMAI 2042]|nr:hypothetical protein STAN_5741 [Streptomyces sp. CBMAI 2042]